MKQLLNKYVITGFLALAIAIGLGPRVQLDETIKAVSLTEDIENYLLQRESAIPDIRHDTEKSIVWANSESPSKTPLAIVYLHGFSASRQEIAPVSDLVAKSLGANLFHTRLTGHGRNSAAMADITVNALLNDAVEALEIGKALGDQVILIGTSTGGTLATWLATYDKNDSIAALVLVSPNFGPKRAESELLLLPWANTLLKLVEGPSYQFEPLNDLQEQYWTTQYPSEALMPMMGLVKLVRDKPLNNVNQPLLIFYSPADNIVDVESILAHYTRFSSSTKQLVAITDAGDPQQHILAGRIMSPQTTDKVTRHIVEFVRQLPVSPQEYSR